MKPYNCMKATELRLILKYIYPQNICLQIVCMYKLDLALNSPKELTRYKT